MAQRKAATEMLETLITVIHVLVSFFLILVILLQAGKDAGMGAAMGGGSSSVFGGRGAGSFLGKVTAASAAVFFLTSLTLSFASSYRPSVTGLIETPAATAPAAPTPAAPAGDQAPAAPGAGEPVPAAPEQAAPATDTVQPGTPPPPGAGEPAAPAPAGP